MRVLLLACCLFLATPALAQKPPPLGVPWEGPSAPPSTPSGKPPPLGAEPRGSTRPEAAFAVPGLPNPQERPISSGTGFVVADGRVLTNRHVVADCGRVIARNAGGARLPAGVLATDEIRDLAVLAVPATIGPPLTFRDVPPVRRGENVITYGFPLSGYLSSGPSLTTGNISALAGIRDNPTDFQISAAVQPGNSGGPLFDSRGNVIGVVVSKLNASRVAQITGDIPQNVNFAVKGTEALAFLREHAVQPRTASSTGPEKRADEVDAVANPSTVYLQCYR
ncbi:MAG: trypsin-like peptidase domain-containing protein [Acetobacteraceae bacterium]|nr:trypsin-like peptidase domain-containing protein [Acetobacteraceae bacterium]